MNLVVVNIYNDYYFHEVDLYRSYYVQSFYYKGDNFDDSFLGELERAIIMANGDNIKTSIKHMSNVYFIDISLLNRFVKDFDEHANDYSKPNNNYISRINQWFDENLIIADDNDVKVLFKPILNLGEGFYINLQLIECVNIVDLVEGELQEDNIDFSVINKDKFTYNAGAGSIGEAVLIWIAKKCGDIAFDKLKKRIFGDKIILIETAGIEKIIEYLETNCQVSRLHLCLKETNSLENGDMQVKFSTYYQDFVIIHNKKYEIKNLNVVDRTKTRI